MERKELQESEKQEIAILPLPRPMPSETRKGLFLATPKSFLKPNQALNNPSFWLRLKII